MPYNNRPIAIVNKITELNWLKTRSAHQFISLGVRLNNRSKLRLWTWCKCSQMSPKSSGTVSGPIWTSRSWPRSTLGMKGLGLETCAWTSQSRPRNSCLRIVSDGWRTPRHPVVRVRGGGWGLRKRSSCSGFTTWPDWLLSYCTLTSLTSFFWRDHHNNKRRLWCCFGWRQHPARHILAPRVRAVGACPYLLPFNCIFLTPWPGAPPPDPRYRLALRVRHVAP